MQNTTVNIYDAGGRLVKQEPFEEKTNHFSVSVAELGEGMYSIELIGDHRRGTITFIKSM